VLPVHQGATAKGSIVCFATHGDDHLDAERIRRLLEPLSAETFPFAYERKLTSAIGLVKAARRRRPSLIVMEGTGIAGGLAVIAIDAVLGIPFVVCSGDAVGPYLRLRSRPAWLIGGLYERLLCRRCAGYVGWTPYLVGRALTFGARRGMTAPGWAREQASEGARERIREALGIPADALVVGLAGSLGWTESVGYVYGLELVRAVRRLKRRDVVVCIVGDGSGRERLQHLAGADLGGRVLLPGRVPPEQVADHLAAFDLASLPQSVDRVGAFRYSTKLSEYTAAGLPIVTGETPAAYDLDDGGLWRLPGSAPWSATYTDALTELLEGLTAEAVAARREAMRTRREDPFEMVAQQRRMCGFVEDLLAGEDRSASSRSQPASDSIGEMERSQIVGDGPSGGFPAAPYRRLRNRTARLRKRLSGASDTNHSQRDALLARLPRGGVGVEIGTWKGDFSARILGSAQPRRLYLVDPWRHRDESAYSDAMYGGELGGQEQMEAIHQSVRDRFKAEIERGQVTIRRSPSTEVAADFAEGELDWVYIDGDHTYEAVKADLEAYCRALKPGGLLTGDDYGEAGWWDNGVTRAVDEFAASGRCAGPVLIGSQFLFTKL
jgi:hypothetical protein